MLFKKIVSVYNLTIDSFLSVIMDSPSVSTEPSNASLLARLAPGRFRIGGKFVDKATQKRIEELIEESKLLKSIAHDAIKECEEAKNCLRKIRDELNKKMGRSVRWRSKSWRILRFRRGNHQKRHRH